MAYQPPATAQAWSRYILPTLEASVGMNGSGGMSPRKQMGMGKLDSGAGAVKPFPAGTAHPDVAMGTATRPAMSDASRGVGMPVGHTAGQLPAQAAPDHGPHFERQLGGSRGGKY